MTKAIRKRGNIFIIQNTDAKLLGTQEFFEMKVNNFLFSNAEKLTFAPVQQDGSREIISPLHSGWRSSKEKEGV